jgi:hypothetical protein
MMLPWRSIIEPVNWRVFYRDNGMSFDIEDVEFILHAVSDKFTIYVCNGADGWVSLFEQTVKRGKLTAWLFRTTVGPAAYPVHEMMYWCRGDLKRHIRVLKDGERWTFLSKGPPLPFECAERYAQRLIGKRVDQPLVEYYSGLLGFDVNSLTQLTTPVVHFMRKNVEVREQ